MMFSFDHIRKKAIQEAVENEVLAVRLQAVCGEPFNVCLDAVRETPPQMRDFLIENVFEGGGFQKTRNTISRTISFAEWNVASNARDIFRSFFGAVPVQKVSSEGLETAISKYDFNRNPNFRKESEL